MVCFPQKIYSIESHILSRAAAKTKRINVEESEKYEP